MKIISIALLNNFEVKNEEKYLKKLDFPRTILFLSYS
jgi:hypothetical protein